MNSSKIGVSAVLARHFRNGPEVAGLPGYQTRLGKMPAGNRFDVNKLAYKIDNGSIENANCVYWIPLVSIVSSTINQSIFPSPALLWPRLFVYTFFCVLCPLKRWPSVMNRCVSAVC